MRKLPLLFLATIVLAPPAPSEAQTGAVTSIVPLWNRMKGLYLASVDVIPEDQLGFKPAADVRSFGQIVGHVINDHYVFCAAAKGEKDPNTTDYEKTTTRAGLKQGLEESYAYCDPVYRMTDARAMEEVTFFGSKGSRLWVATFNIMHDGEHYGNLVTYFRVKGIVPPSSRQQ